MAVNKHGAFCVCMGCRDRRERAASFDRSYHSTEEPPPTQWMADAACRGQDTSLWFPTTPAVTQAVAVCRTCPVSAECAAYADSFDPLLLHGVWAGVTTNGRRKAAQAGVRRDLRESLTELSRRAEVARESDNATVEEPQDVSEAEERFLKRMGVR